MKQFDEMPGMLFHILHRAHHNAMHAGMAAAGLEDLGSPMILMVLKDKLEDRSPPSQRDLAEALHVTPATVAMSLKALERAGYVEKKADIRDQRCKRVYITQKGLEAVDTCKRTFKQVDVQMFSGMTEEERGQIDAFHMRMLENLKSVGGDIEPTHNRSLLR